MQLLKPITIDLINLYPLPILKAQQGNIGRGALITLTANGAIAALTDETVSVYVKKPDGTKVYASATVLDGKAKVLFTSQMLAVPGKAELELELINDTDYITTPIAILEVERSNIDGTAIESSNEFSAFAAALAKIGPAAVGSLGTVKPDGTTITAAADGTITADPANTEIPFTVPATYTQPTTGNLLKNIVGNLVAGVKDLITRMTSAEASITEQNSNLSGLAGSRHIIPIVDIPSILDFIVGKSNGIYIVYTQRCTDSPVPGTVSFTIINKAGADYVFMYNFAGNKIHYSTINSSSTTIDWTDL